MSISRDDPIGKDLHKCFTIVKLSDRESELGTTPAGICTAGNVPLSSSLLKHEMVEMLVFLSSTRPLYLKDCIVNHDF